MAASGKLRSCASRIGSWIRRIERDGVALWFACKHPATPFSTKAFSFFAVAYALNPIDLYSDFHIVLGFVDDLIVVPGLIWLTIKLLPPDVLAQCRAEAAVELEGKGKWRFRLGMAALVVTWAMAGFAVSWYFRS